MTSQEQYGEDIELLGKSGHRYQGKIYNDKQSTSTLKGKAIACLSNSRYSDQGWEHQVNSIYNTDDITNELSHFSNRDDISHLILLPYDRNQSGVPDQVDDLIRQYIHK